MRHVKAVLSYEGKEYVIEQEEEQYDFYEDADDHARSIYYMWTDGNYGCDCNRKLFIERVYDDVPWEVDEEEFPSCGKEITLVSLTIDDQTWDMEEERKKDEEFMARGLFTMRVRHPDLYEEYVRNREARG